MPEQDTVRDAAIGVFVYRLAPAFGGSYEHFTREQGGKRAALVHMEKQNLVRALRMDPVEIVEEVREGRVADLIDLTGVEVDAEVQGLESRIKPAWVGWFMDGTTRDLRKDLTEEENAWMRKEWDQRRNYRSEEAEDDSSEVSDSGKPGP